MKNVRPINCNPPTSCFVCRYTDCILGAVGPNKAEAEMSKAWVSASKHKKKIKKKHLQYNM